MKLSKILTRNRHFKTKRVGGDSAPPPHLLRLWLEGKTAKKNLFWHEYRQVSFTTEINHKDVLKTTECRFTDTKNFLVKLKSVKDEMLLQEYTGLFEEMLPIADSLRL